MSEPQSQDELEATLATELKHTLKLVPESQRELFIFELAKWYTAKQTPTPPVEPLDGGEIRHTVHMAMLEKSESASTLGELTVVPLGFAVDVALALIKADRAAQAQALLGSINHLFSPNPINGARSTAGKAWTQGFERARYQITAIIRDSGKV